MFTISQSGDLPTLDFFSFFGGVSIELWEIFKRNPLVFLPMWLLYLYTCISIAFLAMSGLFAPCYLLWFLPETLSFARVSEFLPWAFWRGRKKGLMYNGSWWTYLDPRSRSSDRGKSAHDRRSPSPPAGEANWWDTECTSSWLVKMALDPDIPDVPESEVQILPNEYAHFVMVFLYFFFKNWRCLWTAWRCLCLFSQNRSGD